MNLILFLIPAAIWGSTFFAIKFQLGIVPATLSVVYRFALATLIFFLIAYFRKSPLRFSLKNHFYIFCQGAFLFSINYILTYESEKFLTSGVVALGFTTVIYFNILGVRIFFGQKINYKTLLGATVGAIGLVLIFFNEIQHAIKSEHVLIGLILMQVAALSASAGNLLTARNHRHHLPFLSMVTWGMLYGTLISLFVALAKREPWIWDYHLSYTISLLYLSLFGSVIAFSTYLTLIGRIGAEKAAYVNIISPVLALLLSTFFENFTWTIYALAGVVLCLAGNFLVLKQKKASVSEPS